jgi:hypothetical protein
MSAEKLSSKIGIRFSVNLGKFPKERKYSIFCRKSDISKRAEKSDDSGSARDFLNEFSNGFELSEKSVLFYICEDIRTTSTSLQANDNRKSDDDTKSGMAWIHDRMRNSSDQYYNLKRHKGFTTQPIAVEIDSAEDQRGTHDK